MTKKIRVYEIGIDDNRDRHCDLCGWFVNEYERHRARLMCSRGSREERPEWSVSDHHLERMSAEEFSDVFIKDSPYAKSDWNPNKCSSVRAYSENLLRGLSCKAVNCYLRSGVVPEDVSESQLIFFIGEMNASISSFVVDKPVTLYRGMRFRPGDAYLNALDDAFETMKATGRPALLMEKGFMSTSRDYQTMWVYAASDDPSYCHIHMSVTLERGVAAMPLSLSRGTTTKKNDKEVLLASGGTYYIIGMGIEPRGNGLCDYYINLLATNRRI